MPSSLVITRPFSDITTSYLHRWSLKSVKYARSKIRSVADLDGKRANKKELTSVLLKVKPDLVVLNGHGAPDFICGERDEILIKVGVNEHILKGAIVYVLSCSTARILGIESMKAGAKAYIGYIEDFIFLISDNYSTKAEMDPLAKLFLEPTEIIVESLIDGYSPKDSHQRGLDLFNRNLENTLLSGSRDQYVTRFLIWNMSSQICYD